MTSRTFTAFSAATLDPEELGENDSGWTIDGEIHEDYYQWVNEFAATHDILGWVSGDYESVVNASSEEALAHFMEHHPPHIWDYRDI